jgi:hypothetical protein
MIVRMLMPSARFVSAVRATLAHLVAGIAPAIIWPRAWKPSRRELAAMAHDIVRSEIVAVAGEPPSAYGIGWNHRPLPRWRTDTGVSGGPADDRDDFGDPGLGVPAGVAQPSFKWSARRAALAA